MPGDFKSVCSFVELLGKSLNWSNHQHVTCSDLFQVPLQFIQGVWPSVLMPSVGSMRLVVTFKARPLKSVEIPPTANLLTDWSPQKRVNRDKLDQWQKMCKSRFNHKFCSKTCFNHQYYNIMSNILQFGHDNEHCFWNDGIWGTEQWFWGDQKIQLHPFGPKA